MVCLVVGRRWGGWGSLRLMGVMGALRLMGEDGIASLGGEDGGDGCRFA